MKLHIAAAAIAVGLALGFTAFVTPAQEKAPQESKAPQAAQAAPSAPPAARPNDVDSLDHIMAAVYDVISGPAGPRDWNRFHSLFYTGARLIATYRDDKGKPNCRDMSADDYAKQAQAYFDKNAFFESAIANRTESWDRIAEVWSTYESHHAKGDKPFARGINSFQLYFDGSRWWVLTIFWEDEDSSHALPEKYLTAAR
jgi:hypothetical protein